MDSRLAILTHDKVKNDSKMRKRPFFEADLFKIFNKNFVKIFKFFLARAKKRENSLRERAHARKFGRPGPAKF